MPENTLKVCLVDDDRIYQFAARKAIESLGGLQQLNTFVNGREALSHLQKLNSQSPGELPDLIFVDLNMPVMDGWGFLDALLPLVRLWCKRPAVYVVSSSIDDRDIVRSRAYPHVADYLVKPVHKDRFKQLISQHRRQHLQVVHGGYS